MFATVRVRFLSVAIALLALVGTAGAAEAGWVTVRNDSNRVLIVQGTVNCKAQPMRCKPVRLLPGESVRVFQPNGASVRVEVFDGQNPSRNLYSGNHPGRDKDQTFSITSDGKSFAFNPAGVKE